MNTVFILQHSYEQDGCNETKFIGVYSSQVEAEAAIERLRIMPGFRRRPEDFHIEEYELNEDNWTEGYATMRTIEAKGLDGEWIPIGAAEVHDNVFEVCERAAEDYLDGLKWGDYVECEERDGVLYVVRKISK